MSVGTANLARLDHGSRLSTGFCDSSQVWAVRDLPLHHRDPFDRLLIAQARDLGVPLISADEALSAYDVAVRW